MGLSIGDSLGQFDEFRKRDLILVCSKRCRVHAAELSSLDKPCGQPLGTGVVGPVSAHVTSLSHGVRDLMFDGSAGGLFEWRAVVKAICLEINFVGDDFLASIPVR